MKRSFVEHLWARTLTPLYLYMRNFADYNTDEIQLVDVSPEEIKYTKMFPPEYLPVIGENAVYGVVPGPWDFLKKRFEKHRVYHAIKTRIEGGRWRDTFLSDKSQVYLDAIDDVIESIEENGYVPQSELDDSFTKKDETINGVKIPDEIIVGRGRDGDLIQLSKGRHRLSIAKMLGVEKVPVIVSIKHPKTR